MSNHKENHIGDTNKMVVKRYSWIVKYSTGSWDDFMHCNLFVTENEELAKAYVEKHNKMLAKWQKYWEQFENEDQWMEDQTKDWNRWNKIVNRNVAYYDKIDVK
jgi:hypothetical protein